MAHKHSVYDTDAHLTIVPALRRIIGAENIRLVRGDHNSTRVTFDMPRFVDGHDMAETSIVEIHYINITADAKNTNEDVYIASDVQISPDSDDVVIFSWLISGNATKYEGTLSFMLCFKCLTGDALDYSWRTDTAKGVSVLASLDCVAAAVEDITDILTVWELKIADLQGRVDENAKAIDGKLDKVTEPGISDRVYTVSMDGTQQKALEISHATTNTWSMICGKAAGGIVRVGTPYDKPHAVPLGYANEHFVPQIDNNLGAQGAYIQTGDGTHKLLAVGYGAPTQYTLVGRDTGGVVVVGTPTADNHATPKQYVDDKCGWKRGYVAGANEYIVNLTFQSEDGEYQAVAYDVYVPLLGRDYATIGQVLYFCVKSQNGDAYDFGYGSIYGQIFFVHDENGEFVRLEEVMGNDNAASLAYTNAISVEYIASR